MVDIRTILYWGGFALAVILLIWFINILKQAVKIKAIKGFKDRFLIVLFFFLGIIFSIIYLKIKIKKKLKASKESEVQTHQEKKKEEKKSHSSIKKFFRKFWFLLWKDDSLKGWIFSVIFLFVFIRFIFFPLLNLATGSPLSLAIVESCSMYHRGNLFSDFNNWFSEHNAKYSQININQSIFQNFIFKNGLNKGDILFTIGVDPKSLKIGDVIIFNAGQTNPIIHRIISIRMENGKYIFSTMGDNNNGQLSVEQNIDQSQIIGKPIAKIAPYLGWVKLIFFEGSKSPEERGLCKQT